MKLGLARERLGGMAGGSADADLERVLELVDAAHRRAREAITELRDLAGGIDPPVLDHGLGTARWPGRARRRAAVPGLTEPERRVAPRRVWCSDRPRGFCGCEAVEPARPVLKDGFSLADRSCHVHHVEGAAEG